MKLYVAGPMSGIKDLNHPAFDFATACLREQGHEVVSPAEKDREWGQDEVAASEGRNTLVMTEVLRWDLQQILACDGIVLLPGWENSQGSKLERIVAESTGRQVFFWSARRQEMIAMPGWDNPAIPSYVRNCR